MRTERGAEKKSLFCLTKAAAVLIPCVCMGAFSRLKIYVFRRGSTDLFWRAAATTAEDDVSSCGVVVAGTKTKILKIWLLNKKQHNVMYRKK